MDKFEYNSSGTDRKNETFLKFFIFESLYDTHGKVYIKTLGNTVSLGYKEKLFYGNTKNQN